MGTINVVEKESKLQGEQRLEYFPLKESHMKENFNLINLQRLF